LLQDGFQYIAERGIPYQFNRRYNALTGRVILYTPENMSLISIITTQKNGFQSSLLKYPLTNINPIPLVLTSSVRYDPKLFSNYATITIQLTLNTPALPGDVFFFFLYGSIGLTANLTSNVTSNVTLTGPCQTPGGNSFNSLNSVLKVSVSIRVGVRVRVGLIFLS
jgi:hypothetical protein